MEQILGHEVGLGDVVRRYHDPRCFKWLVVDVGRHGLTIARRTLQGDVIEAPIARSGVVLVKSARPS